MIKLSLPQMAHLKQLLDQHEQALRADIREGADDPSDYAQIASEAPDAGDSSFANLTVDLDNAAVLRDTNALRAIQNSRIHIENETYGECVECGLDIPYERLNVQPTAERCAPCQDAYEKTHADGLKGVSI